MTVTFEGKEYHHSHTRPDIPYTLYVGEKELLLVPRKIDKLHPKFPSSPAPTQRITLKLSNLYDKEFREAYNRDPVFDTRQVGFGLEDDEVLVAAVLVGSSWMAYWEFGTLLNGDTDNLLEQSSDVNASFGMLEFDLRSTAAR